MKSGTRSRPLKLDERDFKGRDPSPVPRRLVKAPDAVPKQGRGPLPLPSERARTQALNEASLLPGEKVADGGGRMRGLLLKGQGAGAAGGQQVRHCGSHLTDRQVLLLGIPARKDTLPFLVNGRNAEGKRA